MIGGRPSMPMRWIWRSSIIPGRRRNTSARILTYIAPEGQEELVWKTVLLASVNVHGVWRCLRVWKAMVQAYKRILSWK